MMPRRAADRTRLLAAAGIVALHVVALLLIHRHDRLDAPARGTVVYMQLLLPLPLPVPEPVAAVPVPVPVLAAPMLAHKPRSPVPRLPPVARAITPAPSLAPAPDDERRTAHAAASVSASVPADWADAQAPVTPEKVNVAALVAAAGANERARPKEPLERVRDSQRMRGTMDDSPGARAIARSGRADCTKKYAGGASLDPLRLIPLLYDTITDTGCKW
jgi:hypothetical protein